MDILNINVTDLYYNSDDRSKYKKLIKADGQVKDYELVLKDVNGNKIHVLENSMALRDDDDEIIAYQGILRDVTEKRLLEQQLFQAKKMESIGLLAGGVAHDFNNILTTISGYAELMMLDIDEKHPFYKDVGSILQGVKRAEELIRQLLAFGRKQMIEPKIIDINKVISELHSMLKRLIPEDIAFELTLRDNISFIKADPVQIQQTLVNLVVNAGHAISKQENKDRGKNINISTNQINVDKSFAKAYPGLYEGNYITISVEDSGIGMNEETKLHIFEPFFSTKKEGEGTGLGLATVYGIVKQNHGNIYIDSVPGQGATFKIFWPSSQAKSRDETQIEPRIEITKRSDTLLFVEDDTNVRELACKALASFGYKVITAANGQEALDMVNREYLANKIDLVISDIVMPEMSGDELAFKLRELNPAIKILLCSGFTDSRVSLGEYQKKNAFYFLPKPYSIKKLESRIQEIINRPVEEIHTH
jgi:signal transduction histidine kinase/ActR/RegA family two-component response regulator